MGGARGRTSGYARAVRGGTDLVRLGSFQRALLAAALRKAAIACA